MPVLAESLGFNTPLHRFILDAVLRRRDFSQDKMRERHAAWRRNEENFIAYMPEKDVDKQRRNLREVSGEPQFTTLRIPFDYAVLMSAHTYWTSVFLGRSPILQYEGRTGSSEDGVLAIEAMMGYQTNVGRMLPNWYIWLLDVGKYGLAIAGSHWDREKIVVNREIDVPDSFLGVDLGTAQTEMKRFVMDGYQGNRLYNVRPWDFFPDPRVTVQRMQEGEFCGRYTQVGWNAIAKGTANGRYFNVDILRNMRHSAADIRDRGSEKIVLPFGPNEGVSRLDIIDMNSVDLLEMYIELIPRDWGLGSSSFPEKWVFVIANDRVVIGAQPLGDYHNKFPFYILEYEPDGHAMFKRSLLEIVGPMTDVITWLINTHFYNTRKSLNDMFVVDPTKIVLKDLKDPSPGKIIRLKEEMYGQDVRNAIWQFPVNNVTQQHLADTEILGSLIQRVSGVNDNIMGLLNTGGRKTATEVRTSSTFGINRLKTVAEWFSATGVNDMSQVLLQTTQQHYSGREKLRLAGDFFLHQGAQKWLEVSPNDIQGFYDFVPVDGTLPVDRFAQVSMWTNLLQQMATSPQVLQQYDVGRIFAWIAQLGGLKNIHRFKIQVQEPEELLQQSQAGNVVPIGGPNGPDPRATAGNAPRGEGESPVASQIPGVGSAG